jgi:hypothetical protein
MWAGLRPNPVLLSNFNLNFHDLNYAKKNDDVKLFFVILKIGEYSPTPAIGEYSPIAQLGGPLP